jgi:hypothetical protein
VYVPAATLNKVSIPAIGPEGPVQETVYPNPVANGVPPVTAAITCPSIKEEHVMLTESKSIAIKLAFPIVTDNVSPHPFASIA